MTMNWKRSILAAVVVLAGWTMLGCQADQGANDESLQQVVDAPTIYLVRGVVRFVGEDSLQVRHEAIPEFRDVDGETVGMMAMTMDFALGEGVEVEGIQPGDKVALQLAIDLDSERMAWIESLEVLAEDTQLEF